MNGEKTWQQLHKNAVNNIEQVLEATPNKTAAVWLPTHITKSIKVRQTRYAGHSWRSKDELISDILLWTLSHGRAKAGWPDGTYIQQRCANTEYSLEDLSGAMNDRDGWQERVGKIHNGSVTCLWWWNCTTVGKLFLSVWISWYSMMVFKQMTIYNLRNEMKHWKKLWFYWEIHKKYKYTMYIIP